MPDVYNPTVELYERIAEHIGHNIEAVNYADGENVAIECEDCCVIIVDADKSAGDEE